MSRRFLLLIAPLALGAFAALPLPVRADPATLSVEGQGLVTRAPDRAEVDLTLETADPAATRATAANDAAYRRLADRLRALGVPGDALRTTGFTLRYVPAQPSPPPSGPPPRSGYVVDRQLTVTAPRVDAAGAVVDAAVAAGGEIREVRYALADRGPALRAALAAAVADADAQAQAVAAAEHLRIVGVKSIAVGGSPPVYGPVPFLRAPAAAAETVLPPGPLDVRAGVTVTYLVAP